jgi:thiosulfate reductase cytochrome b subunit
MQIPKAVASVPTRRWRRLAWLVPAALVFAVLLVVAAKLLRETPFAQDFLATYPGRSELPEGAPVGFPLWLNWQHFLNAFFLVFIVRTGWEMRGKKRPAAFWTRRNDGLIRTKNPPVRIGIPLWFHLVVDVLWVLNGVVYVVLLFATEQWMRVVPTNWDVIPNAISAGLQYASLVWPLENGWVNYNALQQLSYFATIFIASPLALITGIRMSPGFAARFRSIERVFPLRLARAIHFPVMIYFLAFVVIHVTLVLTTGAQRNLNHMYAGRDDDSWLGFIFFAVSIVVMVVAWVLAKPAALADLAEKSGTVRR